MEKARILVDARMCGAVGHGIGNYVLQMAEGLAALRPKYELIYLTSPALPLDSLLRKLPHQESKIAFLHPAESVRLAKEVAAIRPALFHTPSFASLAHYPCPHI